MSRPITNPLSVRAGKPTNRRHRQNLPKGIPAAAKRRGQDYENLFIRDASASTRSGKTVYIRPEFHKRITKIVRVIGGNEISLFSYLNNVLEHHFNTWQDDIEELYNKRESGVFEE